jgi:hypothetical protein
MTAVNSPSQVPTPHGIASRMLNADSSYLTADRNLSPSTANGSFLIVYSPTSLAFNYGLFQTNASTNFAGLMLVGITNGSVQLSYGDGAGANTTTNRRAWASAASLSAVSRWSFLAGAIDSSTVARMWHNGAPVSLTASGSASSYSAGSGVASIGRRVASVIYGSKDIVCWAFWDRALSDSELASLTLNPWQLWRAPSRRLWVVPSGGSTYNYLFDVNAGAGLTFSRMSSRYRTHSIPTGVTLLSAQDSTMYMSETVNVGAAVTSDVTQTIEINESLGVGASPSLVRRVSKAFSIAAGAVVTSAQQLPITIVGGIRRGAKLLGSFFGRGSL